MNPSEKYLQLARAIAPYVPESCIPVVVNWIMEYKIHLTLTPQRSTKFGDYRHPYGSQGHRISVNKNLNSYAFLITFIHEMAHLKCWMLYRNNVQAHGKEWKLIFSQLLLPFINQHIFPNDVRAALMHYAHTPAASTCSDDALMRALANYDRVKKPRIEDLKQDALFRTTNGRLFKKGEVIRKRIRCVEIHSNRVYLFHPLAEVIPHESI